MAIDNPPPGDEDESPEASYAVQDLDHLGLVAGLVDELGLVERVDQLIPQDSRQRYLSVGQIVKAMILNGLGFTQRVLYLTPRFFRDKPLERLLGPGIEASHLNDDTLGRALDVIYEYGPTKLFVPLAAQAVGRLGLNGKIGHLDATSLHVDGGKSPEKVEEGVIRLTPGYSRDHRPELAQVVVQFICENQAGIPIFMKSLSGNSNDKSDFRETVSNHIKQLKTEVDLEYLVADSALYTEKTLKELNEVGWISRVPETLDLARELSKSVGMEFTEKELAENELSYRSICVSYGGIRQRWLVMYSQAARERAEKNLKKQQASLGEKEAKAFERLQREAFACKADAEAALSKFCKQLKVTEVHESDIQSVPRYLGKGRPTKDQPADFHEFFIKGGIVSRMDMYYEKRAQKSTFIIATNELDTEKLTDSRLIEIYKKDQQKVERGFRFLKDPMFCASTLFLKSEKRIMALLMIMTLCLLVYAAIEWRIRQALQNSEKDFPDQKGKKTKKPTARWVFQYFSGIRLLTIKGIQTTVLGLDKAQKDLLYLLGHQYVKLYVSSA